MFGLVNVISPYDIDQFCDQYSGRQSLYIPGDQNKFDGLFGWEDINHLLNYGRPSLERVKLVNEKVSLSSDSLNQIDQWLLKGATLVVDSVNQIDPIVSRFANLLSRDLNTHVNVNCYASFPNKQGFDIHYDRHDVFIIQVSGSKVWKVFEPTIQWPLERQQRKETEPNDEEPYLDCTLTQGDVLYIPRGHWHYALADDPSIHLTAGPQSRSPIDFMSWLVGHLMENEPELRQDFPIVDSELLGGTRPDAELDDCFERVKNKLDTVFKTETIRELFKEYCLTSNGLRRHFNLPDFSLLNDLITEDMVFSLADEQKSLVDYKEEDQQARILMRGNMIYLGPLPREALELIFSGKSTITGKAILEACTELNWEQVKVVLLELHKHGVILI